MENNNIHVKCHCVTDVYEKHPIITKMINYHTHGLEKLGLRNLSVVVLNGEYTHKEIYDMFELIVYMMMDSNCPLILIDNNKYQISAEDASDNTEYEYIFITKFTTCFGEDTVRLILPDRDGKFLKDTPSDEYLNPWEYETQYTNLFELYEEDLIQ